MGMHVSGKANAWICSATPRVSERATVVVVVVVAAVWRYAEQAGAKALSTTTNKPAIFYSQRAISATSSRT